MQVRVKAVSVKFVIVFVLAFLIIACASDHGYRTGSDQSISIPYDPYDYDPDDLLAEAQSHCGAYGLRAQFDGETVDQQSVRWRYRHYQCV